MNVLLRGENFDVADLIASPRIGMPGRGRKWRHFVAAALGLPAAAVVTVLSRPRVADPNGLAFGWEVSDQVPRGWVPPDTLLSMLPNYVGRGGVRGTTVRADHAAEILLALLGPSELPVAWAECGECCGLGEIADGYQLPIRCRVCEGRGCNPAPWLTPEARGIMGADAATAVADAARLAVLADCIEEAGCPSAELLDDLRLPLAGLTAVASRVPCRWSIDVLAGCWWYDPGGYDERRPERMEPTDGVPPLFGQSSPTP